jgi:extradiol dioxygenase family protein
MWLQSLLNGATRFNGQGSKQRNIYLRDARQNIEKLKEMF